MENIEQLQQDNAKLQERLNNAAKFFREQKAQIESLTKENEILVEKTKTYEHKIDNLENNNDDVQKLETKIDELEKIITSKDQAYKVLQDTYNEVFAEKDKITKQFKEQEKFENEIINVKVPELEKQLSSLRQLHDDLGVSYDKLNDKYNELIKHNEELVQKLAKAEADLEVMSNSDQKYRKAYEDLNKKYDDLENHKLAVENDYDTLLDKVKNQDIELINERELTKSYREQLFDENICRYQKDDVNNLCDYILEFFKDKKISNKD